MQTKKGPEKDLQSGTILTSPRSDPRRLPHANYLRNDSRSITVRINDRMGKGSGHIIDLSRSAAEEIRSTRAGLARVSVEILSKRKSKR
jgi:hypothetical protein